MTLPKPAFQECTGFCHDNVLALKPVSSQSAIDSLTILASIEIVPHLGTHQPSYNSSHTMKVHYETRWPTAARQCQFALREVSCMQSWHFLTRSLPQVIQSDLTILLASSMQTLVHCVVRHSRPPDLKSSSIISLPFAWITSPRKQTQLCVLNVS